MPNHSISGTTDAGATVVLSGAASASTTANGAGVYSFANLADGNYVVTPSLAGRFFFPKAMNVSVSGADVTKRDFGSNSTASLTYAEIAYDDMQGADAAELDPTNWTVSTWPLGPGGGSAPIAISNHVGISTDNLNSASELWTNAPWPSTGQYVQIQIPALNDNGPGGDDVTLFAMTDVLTDVCYVALASRTGTDVQILLSAFLGTDQNGFRIVDDFASGTAVWTGDDILRIEVIGGTQTVFWNNVAIISAADPRGLQVYPFLAGVDIEAFDVLTATSITNFVAGSITVVGSGLAGSDMLLLGDEE